MFSQKPLGQSESCLLPALTFPMPVPGDMQTVKPVVLGRAQVQTVNRQPFTYMISQMPSLNPGGDKTARPHTSYQWRRCLSYRYLYNIRIFLVGADPGWGSWESGPLLFGGPPNIIKRGENVVRMHVNATRISS